MGEMGSKLGFPWAGIEPRPSAWKADAVAPGLRRYCCRIFSPFLFQGPRRTSGTTTTPSPAAGGTPTGSSTTRSHSGSYTRWRGGSEEDGARFPVTNSKNNSPENILLLPSFRIHSPPPPIWSKKQFWRILTFAQLSPPTVCRSICWLA